MTYQWCDSVTKDEGLHSPKAIAFIQTKCSQNWNRIETKPYSIIHTSKRVTEFLEIICVDNSLNVKVQEK
jgi:hypothetical protein